jgi:Bacterial Ig-like domain (group 2)
MHTKILSFFILLVAALMIASCGGDNTYSPTTVGTTTTAPITLTISPNPAAIWWTGTLNLSATVTGTSNNNVTWKILSTSGETEGGTGSLTSTGANTASYTSPSVDSLKTKPPKTRGGTGGDELFVTVQAQSQANPSITATDTITVTDLVVTVTPSAPTVVEGKTQQFSATVTLLGQKIANQTVSWITDGGSPGTINSTTGLFTAAYKPGETNIIAFASAYSADQGTAEPNTVAPSGITVTINPSTVTLFTDGPTQSFTATVNGVPSQAVTWSIADSSYYGTFDSTTGAYTPPSSFPNGVSQAVQHVEATSVADPTKYAIATVTIDSDNEEDLKKKSLATSLAPVIGPVPPTSGKR